jgi:anti-anti-sigma regulatory factor
MNIQTYSKGPFCVFRIAEDVGLASDLTVLSRMAEKKIKEGETCIAIAFTKDSYLYTRSIATLLFCFELIKERGGKLALIKPNKSILDILKIIDFQKFVMVCSDEEELGS